MAEEPVEEIAYWCLKEYHRQQWEQSQADRSSSGTQTGGVFAPLDPEDM